MQLYDPTSTGPERNNHRAVAPNTLDGMTVGILENGKLNAVEMLRETAALFEACHGCTIAPVYSKSNASAPAPAETLAAAAGKVDFLITGLGVGSETEEQCEECGHRIPRTSYPENFR